MIAKNKNKKSLINMLRKMSIVPVALVALYMFACNNSPQSLSEEEVITLDMAEEPDLSVIPDIMPEFPGGNEALLNYIVSNVVYPEKAMANNIQGRVFVQFVITSKGTIGTVKLLRGVDPELDAEAIRVVQSLPNFTPGRKGGVAVPTWYQVPITFQTQTATANEKPANDTKSNDNSVFTAVDEMPIFPGGDEALLRFIQGNVVYPEKAKDNNIQGRVFVQFVVTAQGTIGEIKVIRGVDPLLDAEAIRVVQSLPNFTPGRKGGVAVPVWYQVPVTFSLGN